jgi:cytochrome c oxidase subunit IV
MAQLAHDADLHGYGADPHGEDPVAHEHPGELTYIKVAIFLAMITIAEVAIYYIEWMHDSGALVPSLIVLSAIKFFMVVSFFMHLKFDHRLLSYTFIGGLVLGAAVILAFMALFDLAHPLEYATSMLTQLDDLI